MQGVPAYPPPVPGNRQVTAAAAATGAHQQQLQQGHHQQIAAEPVVYAGGGAYFVPSVGGGSPGSSSPLSGNYELVYGDAIQQVQAGTPVSVQYESKAGTYPVLHRAATAQGFSTAPYNQPQRQSISDDRPSFNWRGWAASLLNGVLYPVTILVRGPRMTEEEQLLESLERFMQYEESIENELDRVDREERREAWERIAGFEEEPVKLAAIQAEIARSETSARKTTHRREYRAEQRHFLVAEKKKKDRLFRAYNIMRVISVASLICLYVSTYGKPCFRSMGKVSGGSKRMLEDTSSPSSESSRKVFVRKA